MTELNDAPVGHGMNHLEAADRIHSEYPECQDQLVSESRLPLEGPRQPPSSWTFGPFGCFHPNLTSLLLHNSRYLPFCL